MGGNPETLKTTTTTKYCFLQKISKAFQLRMTSNYATNTTVTKRATFNQSVEHKPMRNPQI